MITILQKRIEQQNQYIEQMQKETADIKESMDLINKNMLLDQKKEEAHRAWQIAMTTRVTKTNDAVVKQERSIEVLNQNAAHTSETLQQILAHLKLHPPTKNKAPDGETHQHTQRNTSSQHHGPENV